MNRNENSAGSGLMERLLAIMARLRDPEHGCPWDLEQTFHSIAPYTVEEAHEVADAIERENFDDLREELGELLFQVVFHARMAEHVARFVFTTMDGEIAKKRVGATRLVFAGRSDADGGEARGDGGTAR